VRSDLEIYSLRRPIQKITAGETLRILDPRRFDLIWTTDDWKTTRTTIGRSLGSAGFSAEIAPGASPCTLKWTLHWTEQNTWLGYNVQVQVEEIPQAETAVNK
jgi:glucoamylase